MRSTCEKDQPMWMWIALAAGIAFVIFVPGRWLRRAAAKAMGVPPELQAEAMGDANTVTVNSNDDGIEGLRQSNGDRFSVRWDALAKIAIQLTDTGPHEDDAYVVLSDKNDQQWQILIGSQGLSQALEKASDLPWFSQPQLDAAVAAIQARKLSTRDFLLWANVRDGMAIAATFAPPSSGVISLDDEALHYQGIDQPAITIAWCDFVALQVILQPTGYRFQFKGRQQEFSVSVLTEGLSAALVHAKALLGFEHSREQEALAAAAIRACDLRQTVFTVVQAPAITA